MRYLFGFLCVCALGVVPLVGCSETAGTGGNGGAAGSGGTAGIGGTGGMAGTGGTPECTSPDDCDDGDECTEDRCVDGACANPVVDNGTLCSAGVCQEGACVAAFACTEAGIREAIAAGGGPHYFACDGQTVVTTEAEIVIDNDVILDGLGNLTVDANDTHRVFMVGLGVTAELRGMTVTGGASQDGGGIYSTGTLTLTNSTVSGNTAADDGGGIFSSGWLKLTNSTVSGNTALGGGGIHIAVLSGAHLTLTNSTVSGNTALAGAGGGGIANYGDVLTLTNSTVADNATGTDGAGINSRGAVRLTNSTVSGNTSGRFGGGIYYWGDETLTLTNSTMLGNNAGDGDAIASRAGKIVESKATIIGGDCSVIGGGAAVWVSNGYNIESPGNTCGLDQLTDQANMTEAQLNLGPLADNGGPTMTHALLTGSVAVDRIPEAMCVDADGAPLMTDQRGEPRPETGSTLCDVGAFEAMRCESPEDCDDGHECTQDLCTDGECDATPLEDGTPCGDGPRTCKAGSCVDAFACTEQGIRDAIAEGGGPHTFDCSGLTPVVTQAEIVLDNDVILDGEGKLTVDGNASHRVFSVPGYIRAELRGVTVTGGAVPLVPMDEDQERGGGIKNAGQLTLANCTVSANTARHGAGIHNEGGGVLTLRNSSVSDNQSSSSGAGIFGGGSVTLMNSTVSRNTCGFLAGGIFLAGDLVLTNSTVSDNAAGDAGAGGIFLNGGSLTLTHSTVSGNTASSGVNGLAGYANATLFNTLVDNDCEWLDGEITSGGYNIESQGDTCGFDQPTDQTGKTPAELNLGPLRDNGGPTQTHKPGDGDFGTGSVAIDWIPEADCGATTDQRGEPRPVGPESECDVGSVEVQSGGTGGAGGAG